MIALRSVSFPAIPISILFAATLFYNGVGHTLHWLSFAGIVLLVWLSISIAKLDLIHARIARGWLPAVVATYAAWLFVNPLLSTYPYASSTTAMQLALLPLAFLGWLISPKEEHDRTWRVTWALLLFAGVVLAIWGIMDFLVPPRHGAHGPLIDANAYAALVNLFLIPTAFTYMSATPSGKRFEAHWSQLGIIGLLALAVSMSLSRGALLSLLAILPVLLWLNRRSPMFRWRTTLMLIVLVAAYLLPKALPGGPSKDVEMMLIAPGHQMEHDKSIQARFFMWKASWRIFEKTNPLIGTGLGTYKNYYATYRDSRETMSSGNLAHNDYLQGLQEGGLIQLAFLLTLTVVTPVLFLYKHLRRFNGSPPSTGNDGLLLGIVAISVHALVNFTHYVAPIALLTGLYLARTWETTRTPQQTRALSWQTKHTKPLFLKALVITIVALPVSVLTIDGVIFKLFSPKDPLILHMAPGVRLGIVNAALAIRPDNPQPRTLLIQHLLDAASRTEAQDIREQLLVRAETEASALIRTAPALASGRFFRGRIRVLRGTPEALLLAREDLEQAVKLVPPSAGMRLELLKLYQRLGMNDEAHKTVREARTWIMHEVDYTALAAFAKEASHVAANQRDREEAEFWAWVHGRLNELGPVS